MSIEKDGKSFGNLTNVGKPVNSQKDDFALTFNKDGKSGYFSSNRIGGKGDDDIYSFQLTRSFVFKMRLVGTVLDQSTKQSLAGSTVYLKDVIGNVIASVVAEDKGNYSFDVDPNKEFVIVAKASAEYIKKRISNPQRIYGKGFGESKLKVNCPCEGAVKSNCSEEEHQKNRRTEFIIIKM